MLFCCGKKVQKSKGTKVGEGSMRSAIAVPKTPPDTNTISSNVNNPYLSFVDKGKIIESELNTAIAIQTIHWIPQNVNTFT